jgi:hypothetical protein
MAVFRALEVVKAPKNGQNHPRKWSKPHPLGPMLGTPGRGLRLLDTPPRILESGQSPVKWSKVQL